MSLLSFCFFKTSNSFFFCFFSNSVSNSFLYGEHVIIEEDPAFLPIFDFYLFEGGGEISIGRIRFVDFDFALSGTITSGVLEEHG